jgi:hypothetical protein
MGEHLGLIGHAKHRVADITDGTLSDLADWGQIRESAADSLSGAPVFCEVPGAADSDSGGSSSAFPQSRQPGA